jgi:hypothetical protein
VPNHTSCIGLAKRVYSFFTWEASSWVQVEDGNFAVGFYRFVSTKTIVLSCGYALILLSDERGPFPKQSEVYILVDC